MSKKNKINRPKPRLPKGMRDIEASEIRSMDAMLAKIRGVYELYGFEPLETPAYEYSDVLGKFLPDQERPNAGVFSFEEDGGDWLSLRYDLTAPLARYVAAHYDGLPKPYRRYAHGPVWRNEKPGPGRFRQFTQFDADTVGAPVGAADAEMCMMMADVMEAVGIQRGDYLIGMNNRKLLDGLREVVGLADIDNDKKWLTVLRALDKYDKFGLLGVSLLLGEGRKDESGDFTKGAGLTSDQIEAIEQFLVSIRNNRPETMKNLWRSIQDSDIGKQGLKELHKIDDLLEAAGYGSDRIAFDPTIIR
ncbi:MAG: ATP phosphoribosyltransferase regulatory subunit, partial [Hyphomicrobiaceae bacterium]|nr:ATP phosphoribosyltransferase regulatory subunit [Hyphomicrobiaceae bacterium]